MPKSVLIQLQTSAYNFIKKETVAEVFSSDFREILKYTFLKNIFGRQLLGEFSYHICTFHQNANACQEVEGRTLC